MKNSAPVLVLEISKEECIQMWRDIIGPKDPRLAKLDAPKRYHRLH